MTRYWHRPGFQWRRCDASPDGLELGSSVPLDAHAWARRTVRVAGLSDTNSAHRDLLGASAGARLCAGARVRGRGCAGRYIATSRYGSARPKASRTVTASTATSPRCGALRPIQPGDGAEDAARARHRRGRLGAHHARPRARRSPAPSWCLGWPREPCSAITVGGSMARRAAPTMLVTLSAPTSTVMIDTTKADPVSGSIPLRCSWCEVERLELNSQR